MTDEQAADGRVLPICLEEIRRCRPYFIGLLGERYGWVPDEPASDLVDREPWLAQYPGRSVTELEILHGVLRNPEMAGHAFFYLRDPAYLAGVEPERRADFEEITDDPSGRATAADRQAKLAHLKERIRRSDFPVRDYSSAVQNAVSWLGDRYLLATPVHALSGSGRSGRASRAQLRFSGRREYRD